MVPAYPDQKVLAPTLVPRHCAQRDQGPHAPDLESRPETIARTVKPAFRLRDSRTARRLVPECQGKPTLRSRVTDRVQQQDKWTSQSYAKNTPWHRRRSLGRLLPLNGSSSENQRPLQCGRLGNCRFPHVPTTNLGRDFPRISVVLHIADVSRQRPTLCGSTRRQPLSANGSHGSNASDCGDTATLPRFGVSG